MTTHLRALFVLTIIAILWTSGETCTVGSTTADPNACNQYHMCVKSGAATIQILLHCPDGQNFDPNEGYCTANVECLICD